MLWHHFTVVRATERDVRDRSNSLRREVEELTGIKRRHFQWMSKKESDPQRLGVENDERLAAVEVVRAELQAFERTRELSDEKAELLVQVKRARFGVLDRVLVAAGDTRIDYLSFDGSVIVLLATSEAETALPELAQRLEALGFLREIHVRPTRTERQFLLTMTRYSGE